MGDNNKNTNSHRPADLPFITRLKLFLLELSQSFYIRPDDSINRRIFSLIDFKASAARSTKPIDRTFVSTSDVPVEPAWDLWFRLFIPSTTDNKPLPLIVYFHGGGFRSYGPDSTHFDHLCTNLAAKAPAVVASVNYRLSPEHKYPSQYDDGLDALRFIDAQNYDVLPAAADLSRCFVMGDSSGGNIAHHVTVRALRAGSRFEKLRIAGVIGVQPFFGGEERTESELRLARAAVIDVEKTDAMWRSFLPEGADRNHPAAYVFGGPVLKDVEFPRTLVIVGGYDPLQDWHRKYIEWLKGCGTRVEVTEYPNAFHAFYCFSELPEFALLLDDVASFIRKT